MSTMKTERYLALEKQILENLSATEFKAHGKKWRFEPLIWQFHCSGYMLGCHWGSWNLNQCYQNLTRFYTGEVSLKSLLKNIMLIAAEEAVAALRKSVIHPEAKECFEKNYTEFLDHCNSI